MKSLLLSLLVLFASRAIAETRATVLSVIDGDTIVVRMNGTKEHVRLIGIDTPESIMNDKAFRDSSRTKTNLNTIIGEGKTSAAFSRSLLHSGDPVSLEFDVEKRDHYGRILAYVYNTDGTMINEEIVRAGYASLMTHPPNVKYAERFRTALKDARSKHRGLWSK